MSSYRSSYTPWKSSLPSTYKTGTSSAYSSRDDVSSTTRYSSSLASPTSYRPSFSGGTYRLKRDTTSVPATSSYVSRYASSSSSGISSISKPESSSISDSMSSKSTSQLKRYGSTSSSLGKWSREPSPAALEHTNRIRSRDPSPASRSLRGISRDPSPSLDSKSKIGYSALSSYRMNVPKGPPPTSYNTRYSSTSSIRTPSSSSLADKSISYLTASDFRARTISKTKELTERKSNEKELESAPSIVVVEAPQVPSKQQEKQEEVSEDSDTTEESDTSEDEETEPPEQFIAIEVCTRGTSPTPPGASPSVQMARRVDIAKTIEKTMLRSTKKRKMIEKEMQSDRLDDSTKYSRFGLNSRLSPYSPRSDRYSPSNLRYSTSPLSTTSKSTSLSTNESRREDSTTSSNSAAKALKSPVMKSNESRREDSTTSSSTAARALKSPILKSNESRREDSTTSSSSADRALKSTIMKSNESKREDSTASSSSAGRALKSPIMKSKLSAPKVSKMKSRQSSMESLSPHKPPVSPKADSPHKSSSSSNSPNHSTTKLPNKDFRKSSLNVGPTERPRKSRTPSTGNDSDYNTVDALNGALQAIQRLERSPSAGSEVSNVSSRSLRSRNLAESKLRPRCHSKPLGSSTPPSPLSRQNSGTNFKHKTSAPVSPLVARSTKISVKAVISSSSGTDSSAEVKKPLKKIVKKKSIKETSSSNASTTTSLSSTSASESQSISEKLPTQPPVAPTAAAGGKAKKSESSVAKKSSASTRPEKDPLRRLKKLSSVSNFFVTQQKNTNSDDQIYLESSETSGGGGGGGGASGGSGSGATTDLDLGSSKSSKLSKKSGSITRTNEPKTSTTKTTKSNSNTSASNCNSPVNQTRDSANERPNRIATKSSSKSTTQSVKSKSKSKSRSASDTSSSYCPQNSSTLNESSRMPTELESESVSPYASTNTATTSTTGTDSEEPSWWQDTSQQIDTSSALDFSFKDEMRFKVRHIDSGEVGWWLRNDDDDTIADDLATLNQDEEDEDVGTGILDDDNSDPMKMEKELADAEVNDKPLSWRVTENNEPRANDENEKDQLNYKTNGYCTEPGDTESRPFPRSRLSPETDWWQDEEKVAETNVHQTKNGESSPPKQNGLIQLKICRVESGEQPWWVDDSGTIDTEVEEKPQIPLDNDQPVMKEPTPESSETTSNTSAAKKWWMAGPTKKLFNIPRVESGEKAWWQDDRSDKDSKRSKSRDQERVSSSNSRSDQEQVQTVKLSKVPRAESSEKAWWLEEGSDKDNKRSKSRDQERVSSNNSRSDQEQVQTVKLCKEPRAESSEKAWWLEQGSNKDNKRSKSRDQERVLSNNSRSDQEQVQTVKLSKAPRAESNENAWWLEEGSDKDNKRSNSRDPERWLNADTAANWETMPNGYSAQSSQNGDQVALRENSNGCQQGELTLNEVYSPTIKGQKERWLQENSRKYSEPSEKGYYPQVQQRYPETPQETWLEDNDNRPYTRQTSLQSYHSNADDEEVQQYNQHSNALPAPANRAESQTELSNSFNFEYSERPPPLGQCASPVQHEEEPQSRSPPHHDSQRTSPHDNIPMTKVQQTPTTPPNQLPILPGNVNNNNGHADVPPAYLQNLQLNQQQQPSLVQQQQHYNKHRSPPQQQQYTNNDLRSKNTQLFISRHQNIDELLSGSCRPLSPLYFDNESFQTMPTQHNMFLEEVTPDQVRIHDSTAQVPFIQRMERDDWERNPQVATNSISPPRFEQRAIDDAAIQVYKDGDYGPYLDLESSLAEQSEEIEGLNSSRKNSLVVRTQLSVRVHAIIEKLLSAEGSDLRRALFSLKQVFQEDKDLVHAFVALGGLNCLVRVGNGADQNYQNYILRALGQVMLYVDGMNGVMKHEPTMQWLYSLIASSYRSVVKTALKLLLVFVEYAESNCHVLVSAIHTVDKQQGAMPWSNIMRLLKDYDNADAELVIYAASLINKTLQGLNDQDSFYDESDLLEQQGMESVIQHYMSKPGTDMDLLNQLQLYEAVLKFEDGESDGTRLPDNTLRKTQRFRSSTDSAERRKSRRHSTGTSPGNINKVLPTSNRLTPTQPALDEDSSSSTNSAEFTSGVFGEKNHRDGAGVTPGLRRRRERAERHRSFLKEQQEAAAAVAAAAAAANGYKSTELASIITALPKLSSNEPVMELLTNSDTASASASTTTTSTTTNTPTSQSTPVTPPVQLNFNTLTNTSVVPPPPPPPPPPPDLFGFGFMRPINHYNNSNNNSYNPNATTTTTGPSSNTTNLSNTTNNNNNITNINTDDVDYLQINESESDDKKRLLQLKRDHTVKDLTQKLSNLPSSPTHEVNLQNRIVGDMSGLISKAKEGLAKSKSKGEVSRGSSVDQEIKKPEPKKSENELQWEELVRNMGRPLQLCDLDFTDLNSEDEKDILAPRGAGRGVPPPPPPMGGVALPPPMMPTHIVLPPPMMSQSNISNGSGSGLIPPPMLSYSGYGNSSLTNSVNSSMNGSINGDMNTIKKNKKTVKLFWKEVREDLIPVAVGKTIWDELPSANIDTQKLEHLFESRAKDLMTKKQQEMNKSKEVIVLDHKRSNAINIAMTKLPPPRAIKAAILKMDATVVTREGIDKLLNMLPTDEEKGKIQEAQMANPELPLGSAEQFLLTLASISELAARLRLWAFRLDFDNSEKEIAEPLMDLKHGIEILRNNRTFKCILSTLLSVGIFLNGAPVKGFQIEYLAKVPEVKDTVHKHSLLHHLCHIVMETCTETTDLYSEIGPITRASKADFNELAHNLSQLEHECKASWDRLKLIAKHDCPPQLKQKLVDFLADCAERIIILQIVHRRVMNRYRKFLLWLGVPQHSVADSRPNDFCRILSEFALEYRTTRERVQQQIEKKANHRERNKTRGKLIVDIAKFKTKEDKQDDELKVLLGTPSSDTADGTLTWRRRRAENLRSPIMRQSEENFTDGDDEILESLVKTATKAPGTRTTPRERKRTRHADRKSCFCFENVHDEHY